MASTLPPFKALYEQYLTQFNAQSNEGVLACLSPSLQILVRGKLLKKNYQVHWEVPNIRVEMHEIKEMEDGVETKLIDLGRMQLIEIRYVYGRNEDGRWLHVRHEIGKVTAWEREDDL